MLRLSLRLGLVVSPLWRPCAKAGALVAAWEVSHKQLLGCCQRRFYQGSTANEDPVAIAANAETTVFTSAEAKAQVSGAERGGATEKPPARSIPAADGNEGGGGARKQSPTTRMQFWTWEDDQRLRSLVEVHGRKWSVIATYFPERKGLDCYHRWNKLSVPLVGKPFSAEEDNRLRELVGLHGRKWRLIASFLPGRNAYQCIRRWDDALNKNVSREPWTAEEDAILLMLHAELGNQWSQIAKRMPLRSHLQVRKRILALKRGVVRAASKEWKPEELKVLIEAVDTYGEDWKKIAMLLPGRTGDNCRNRYYHAQNSASHIGSWSAQEDETLSLAVKELGDKDWMNVSSRLPGRHWKACQRRWRYHVFPALNASTPWSEEEDALIQDFYNQAKDIRQLTPLLPGRSLDAIRKRWKEVLRPTTKKVFSLWTASEKNRLQEALGLYGHSGKWYQVARHVGTRTASQCLAQFRQNVRKRRLATQQ